MRPTEKELKKIRVVITYQYRNKIQRISSVIPKNIEIVKSNKTKRIKSISLEKQPIFYFRPMDGLFVPARLGAIRLNNAIEKKFFRIIVSRDAEPFIRKGKTTFAKHVLSSDNEIKIGDEVLILNDKEELIGWGTATLPGKLMEELKTGVAIKTRGGLESNNTILTARSG